VLISVMAANNEIGVIEPISEIGALARERGITFHTDASQAVGYVSVDVQELNVDLLSLSGHKLYGPKGVGALFVRRRPTHTKLLGQTHGGGHERRLRPGTLNVSGIVGLGAAIEIATKNMAPEAVKYRALRERLLDQLQATVPDIEVNGHFERRLPHNLSVYIPGIESRSLLVQLENIVALSTGSACTTTSIEPSHVILALGFGEERAHGTLRFGLGRGNTEQDIDTVASHIGHTVARLRSLVAR
jgi:cysteine desulfurase